MSGKVGGRLCVFIVCVASIGSPWVASAQESITVSGVSLTLGIPKGEVLRKLSETQAVFRKITDAEGCETWMDSRKKSEGGTGSMLQFCDGVLCYGTVDNDLPDADRSGAYPFAESLVAALGDLETKGNACTIKTSSFNAGAYHFRSAEITCGELHVSVSAHTGEGFRFGIIAESLGKQVWPRGKKKAE